MIVLQLLRKQRALLWRFYRRKTALVGDCSRRPVGDVVQSVSNT